MLFEIQKSSTLVKGNGHTLTISNISFFVIEPSPSKSYILKAHLNFSSSVPRLVTDNAQMNSRKSIVPSGNKQECCQNYALTKHPFTLNYSQDPLQPKTPDSDKVRNLKKFG